MKFILALLFFTGICFAQFEKIEMKRLPIAWEDSVDASQYIIKINQFEYIINDSYNWSILLDSTYVNPVDGHVGTPSMVFVDSTGQLVLPDSIGIGIYTGHTIYIDSIDGHRPQMDVEYIVDVFAMVGTPTLSPIHVASDTLYWYPGDMDNDRDCDNVDIMNWVKYFNTVRTDDFLYWDYLPDFDKDDDVDHDDLTIIQKAYFTGHSKAQWNNLLGNHFRKENAKNGRLDN